MTVGKYLQYQLLNPLCTQEVGRLHTSQLRAQIPSIRIPSAPRKDRPRNRKPTPPTSSISMRGTWGAGCIPWRCAAEVSYCPCPRAGGARSGCEGTKAACMVAWEGGEGSSSKLSSPLSACALAKVNGLLAAPATHTRTRAR